MLKIEDIASNLELRDGVWYSRTQRPVSYPMEDNDLCFAIEEESFWFKHRNNCITEMVRSFPPCGEIFDIGSGNGFVAKELEQNGFETVLVEPGIHGVQNSKKRNFKIIISSTFEDSGFRTNTLPAIGCFDVIEHIENDKAFIEAIASALIVSGMLYLTVPAYNFLWSNEDTLAGHFRRYSKKRIEELIENCGLEIVHSTFIFSLLTIPVFFFRSIPFLFGYRKTAVKSDDIKKLHHQNSLRKILNIAWGKELTSIRKGRTIWIGSSLMICAIKN